MRPLTCEWFACRPTNADTQDIEVPICGRCGELVSYGDLVGDTLYRRLLDRLMGLWRLLWPQRCPDCERRWRHDNTIEHLPF